MQPKVNEEKFYQTLSDLFIGAKIEGVGGYVNLMKIKTHYYKLILQKFKEEVDNDPILQDSFREEFFDKLYDFFHRYFSETGSVFFVKTTPYQRIYERIYSPDKDVALFWKTHMLYYVKSDILFKNLEVEISNGKLGIFKFYFDVGNLEGKKNNEKRELVFTFNKLKEGNNNSIPTIILNVQYKKGNSKTKINNILKAIRKTNRNLSINKEIIHKAIKTFKKQSEVDFFINKNAKQFLREQLDLYLHQLLLTEENKFIQKRLEQIKTIQKYALKTIDFISQFENELVKIWNKPKFALNANYVITLDRIKPEIIRRIAKHQNLETQIEEWRKLGIVDEMFKFEEVFENNLLGNQLKEKYKYLPIDTKYFKDLELEILSQFENLAELLDGRLIKSENYQALITLLPKYKEKIQTVYIDPPFNKEQEADYFYKVGYKDATWITMLENRIRVGKELLSKKGSTFVRCDYNGNMYVRMLLNEIFGRENFRNEIQVNRTKKIFIGVKGFNVATDNIFLYSKTNEFLFYPVYKERIGKQKWINMHSPGERKPPERIILGRMFYPPKGRHWTFVQEKIYELDKEGRIRINEDVEYLDIRGRKIKGMPQYLTSEKELLDSNWTDIPGYSSTQKFPTENSEVLLKRVIEAISNEDDLVLDYFLGSGTTTAVAHKLKRKWLGIDMGEHLYTVALPRMKKILYYDKSGISRDKDVKKIYNPKNAGGLIKYYELEQYEDTLRKAKYKDYQGDTLFDDSESIFSHYIFFGDEKLAFEDVIKQNDNGEISLNFDRLYPNIDWPETLSNLLGLPIKKIKKGAVILQDRKQEREIKFGFKNMSNKEKIEFLKLIKPLIWWGE